MDENEKKSMQEYEFVMDGITTRMQLAIEKMAESNKLMHSAVKWVCTVAMVVVPIVVAGFIILARTK